MRIVLIDVERSALRAVEFSAVERVLEPLYSVFLIRKVLGCLLE